MVSFLSLVVGDVALVWRGEADGRGSGVPDVMDFSGDILDINGVLDGW